MAQERRLKRQNTLGGLDITIRHQIVNTLELSDRPPPKKKNKQKKKKNNSKKTKKNGEVSNNKYL